MGFHISLVCQAKHRPDQVHRSLKQTKKEDKVRFTYLSYLLRRCLHITQSSKVRSIQTIAKDNLSNMYAVQVTFLAADFPTLVVQSLTELGSHPYSGNIKTESLQRGAKKICWDKAYWAVTALTKIGGGTIKLYLELFSIECR